MSLFEDTNPRELKYLLREIQKQDAALPEFQRDFVWDPSATQELIQSIASNYPAGSLLRIRNTHNLFARREFQGAPQLDGHKPTYLVLDGQQRLTSLYQAFYGVGDHRYFLDLNVLMGSNEFEDAIFHLRGTHKRAQALAEFGTQADELILPLNILCDGTGGFSKWSTRVMQIKRKQLPEEEHLALEEELLTIQGTWVQTIDDYRFPVVTLSDSTSAEAVCTIFETLNRTGVKLSVFELLTARFWPKGINLRQLWTETRESPSNAVIEDYDVDPYYLLQSIALVSNDTQTCKRSDVLDLKAESVNHWWQRVAAGTAAGLKILRDECGVVSRQWVPIYPLLVTLGALLADPSFTGPSQAVVREKLIRWFWCSALGAKYESGPNSQAVKDFIEVRKWLDGGDEPETVRTFRFDRRVLRETTFRQRLLYKSLICLILSRHPRDFHKGDPLNAEKIADRQVDDHHIFPVAFLEGQPTNVSSRVRDSVLNRTLIDKKTNIRIGKRAPSDYMSEIQSELLGSFSTLLESHLMPSGSDSPLFEDNFQTFLDAREELIWAEIKRVTGMQDDGSVETAA